MRFGRQICWRAAGGRLVGVRPGSRGQGSGAGPVVERHAAQVPRITPAPVDTGRTRCAHTWRWSCLLCSLVLVPRPGPPAGTPVAFCCAARAATWAATAIREQQTALWCAGSCRTVPHTRTDTLVGPGRRSRAPADARDVQDVRGVRSERGARVVSLDPVQRVAVGVVHLAAGGSEPQDEVGGVAECVLVLEGEGAFERHDAGVLQ